MIRNILENSIKTALWELQIDEAKIGKINLEHPEELSHGDYSCNIAMILAKQVSQNPRELAGKIVAEILEKTPKEVIKVEVAGPGFINFYLSPEFFIIQNKEIIKSGQKFGLNRNLKGQKTIIEYTDPNPFKEFHIGHLMSNTIGEAVSRIIEANGAKVERICYGGDVGLHVAKTIWGVERILKEKPQTKKGLLSGLSDFERDITLWGKAYVLGAKSYEEDETAKKEIIEINKKVYSNDDKDINTIYKIGRKISLEKFEKIYKTLGTKFDKYLFESQTTDLGTKIVLDNLSTGIFEKSEGAIVFKGEKYGLHTRVFINREGLPTYDAKDLGLAKLKEKAFSYNKSIIVTANEQSEYFKVLLKALSLIYPELALKTTHISHGMFRTPTGKIGSRMGNAVTGEFLLHEIKKLVFSKMTDVKMTEKEKNNTADIISVGALKYSILRQIPGKNIIFDSEKEVSFDGDSGPYLQYSYARARSILRKAKEEKIPSMFKFWSRAKVSDKRDATELEKMMYRFPEVVERAGKEYSAHYIATYLIELASSFNNFYGKGKIVDKEDAESPYKVILTEAFSIVLKNGLNLLGIQAPEKM